MIHTWRAGAHREMCFGRLARFGADGEAVDPQIEAIVFSGGQPQPFGALGEPRADGRQCRAELPFDVGIAMNSSIFLPENWADNRCPPVEKRGFLEISGIATITNRLSECWTDFAHGLITVHIDGGLMPMSWVGQRREQPMGPS